MKPPKFFVVTVKETVVRDAIVLASGKREARTRAKSGAWESASDPDADAYRVAVVGRVKLQEDTDAD